MANVTTTNIDYGNVVLGDARFQDGLITFAGAATFAAGTILAVDSVSLKFVKFVKGGATNQNGIPKAVLTYAVTASGAGDVAARVMIEGRVNKKRLVIDADGNDTNVDQAVRDQLRAYGITPEIVDQIAS